MSALIELLFWILALLIVYAYLGYPVLLVILVKARARPVRHADEWPSVTLMIAAHNEEAVIRQKIENTAALDYPRDRLEVVIASDGSTDATDSIVLKYSEWVKLHAFERGGKTEAHNRTVPLSAGEIVVFSDADSMYEPDALKRLIRNFADLSVGYVCGQLRLLGSMTSSTSSGEGLYWRYELFLRSCESRLGSITAGNGAIYAIRKGLYVPLRPWFGPDFCLPLEMVRRGYRAVYEPSALACETPIESSRQEIVRRLRYTPSIWQMLWHYRGMYNPCRYGLFSIQIVSHRLLRYLAPFLLVLVFPLNLLLLNHSLYQFTFALQVMFYTAALLGYALDRIGVITRWLYVPYYFCLINFGVFVGSFRVRKRVTMWAQHGTAEEAGAETQARG